jgi:hypothetical protein
MSQTTDSTFPRRHRRAVLTLAGVAAFAMAGSGAALAASSGGAATPSGKIVKPAVVSPKFLVSSGSITLGPGGYASGSVSCPAGTLIYGGGESNTAPGTLLLTDSWPTSDTSWLVYVKSVDTTNTYSFTVHAICR